MPLYRHTLSVRTATLIWVCLYRGTLPKNVDDRYRRTCYRFNGLKPSKSQPNYVETRWGWELGSPSPLGIMAGFLQTPIRKRAGQGAARVCALPMGLAEALFFTYRAFTHKIRMFSMLLPLRVRFFSRSINNLRSPIGRLIGAFPHTLSTHICPYIYTTRDSTHLSTVTPPTFPSSMQARLGGGSSICVGNSEQHRPNSTVATVLSPTFSPYFQSQGCRASNHPPTVTLPTKETRSTVTRPTKTTSKYLKQLQRFPRKDVFKICFKKTSGVMMSFFLLVFFSWDRRPSHQ
jgi:hypothetical protein